MDCENKNPNVQQQSHRKEQYLNRLEKNPRKWQKNISRCVRACILRDKKMADQNTTNHSTGNRHLHDFRINVTFSLQFFNTRRLNRSNQSNSSINWKPTLKSGKRSLQS